MAHGKLVSQSRGLCVCMYVRTYVCKYVRMYVCMYVGIAHVGMHMGPYIYIYIYIHVCDTVCNTRDACDMFDSYEVCNVRSVCMRSCVQCVV
jgi:hypothetical protein